MLRKCQQKNISSKIHLSEGMDSVHLLIKYTNMFNELIALT